MSKTKTCPACQKELPILAVRCKYCGFKLSSKPVAATARDSFTSLPGKEPPMARLSSTPPPPPPARAPSVPPPPPGGGSAKKTMMMGTFTPARKPVGLGKQASSQAVADRTTMPPPTPGRPSAPPPPPPRASVPPPRPSSPPPRPSGPDLDDDALDLSSLDSDVEETGSWIPDAGEVTDESQLLELSTDDSALIEIDDGGAHEGGSESDEDYFEEETPGFFLFRFLFEDEALDGFDEKGWPAWLVKFLGKLRWIYVGGAAVLILGVVILSVAIAVSGADQVEVPQAVRVASGQVGGAKPVPAEGVQTQKPTATSAGAGDEQPEPEKKASAAIPVPGVGEPAIAVPDPGTTCRSLAEYPDFPWKDEIQKIASAVGASSVCGIFGQGVGTVQEKLGDTPIVGPGGFDAVKGGALIEAFTKGKATRNAPSIELLFVGDKLYEIRLNYRETEAKDLEVKPIEEALELESEGLKDSRGRKIARLVDGDMVVDYVEESWYGRTLKILVFASKPIRDALATELDNYEKAMSFIVSGDGLFGRWKFEDALEKYEEAASAMDGLGLAHVKQALMLTRLEKFDKVEKVAKKALEVSAEKRVRAEALGLLAVTALYNGDKAGALARFREAAETDPANGFFEMSAGELETGKYDTARVARTAARMECLKKKSYTSTFRGLLARGNFPDNKTYFDVLKKAMADPGFKKMKKDAARGECR